MPTALNRSELDIQITENGRQLHLGWPDGQTFRYHAIWLRDNGQDENTRGPSNGQKLFTLQDIPENLTISRATLVDSNHLELEFGPDQWQTWYELDWLRQHQYDTEHIRPSLVPGNVTTWDSNLLEKISPVDFTEAKSDPATLLGWLKQIDRYGVGLMRGLPEKNAAVLDVIKLFGYIRETNYGEYFEIRSEVNPENLASTSLGLQSHTDNPYRDPVPGLQFFGCLENNADGGESVVVDGFRIAEILATETPDHFELLCSYDAQFEFKGDKSAHLRSDRPMIECSPQGQIIAIRFNNRSCHTLTSIPFDKMEDYYQAYRHFGDLVNSPHLQGSFKLDPGSLFVTDNTRVLHGRTGFSGKGNRWMQGAYADRDSLKSKIRVLEKGLAT